MENLGFANGWLNQPEVVKNCTHRKEEEKIGHCHHQVMCTKCNYVYSIDSSD